MTIKLTFKQKDGSESWGIVDMSKAVATDFYVTTQMRPNESGEEKETQVPIAIITFPWQVQKLIPKNIYQPGGKGKPPRISHISEELAWMNYTIVVENEEDYKTVEAYAKSLLK